MCGTIGHMADDSFHAMPSEDLLVVSVNSRDQILKDRNALLSYR